MVGFALLPVVVICCTSIPLVRLWWQRKIWGPGAIAATSRSKPAARRGIGVSPLIVIGTIAGVCR